MEIKHLSVLAVLGVFVLSGSAYLLDVGNLQCRMASNCATGFDADEDFEFDIRVNEFEIASDGVLDDPEGGPIFYEANISNPRDGLKGVPMKDISYTVSLKDGSEHLCSTGSIEELELLEPGSSWLLQPSEETFDSLTYENCGLDNRSGENLEAELNLEYSHSSSYIENSNSTTVKVE